MRVLFIAGYRHPSQHRKLELLADAVDVEIMHIAPPNSGKRAGPVASANGQRVYRVRIVPLVSLGQPDDPHRVIHFPPAFGLREFKPQIIQCEYEQEGLLLAQAVLARWALARRSALILNSAQNLLRPRSLLVRGIAALTLRATDHVTCWSQEAAVVLAQQGFRGGTTIMPTIGLDRRHFFPKPAPELRRQLGLEGAVVIGYVGRLSGEKGIDLLLQAGARVNARLLLIGDGPEKARLETLAHQLGIADRCLFVGNVALERVPEYMNLFDVLALPSRTTPVWKEQFGRVLVEAMGCKVAVVGAASGAIPEVIGDAGRLFPEGDAAGLATVLDELITTPGLRHEFAERGYQRAIERYTVERLASRTLDLWRGLVSAERPAT